MCESIVSRPKCGHCPLGGDPLPCAAHTRPHPRFCELIDPGHPAFNPAYNDVIIRFSALDFPGATAPQGEPLPPNTIQVGVGSLAADLRTLAAMKACPSWVKSSDCGCGNNRCAAGKGRDGIVSHADCFACLGEN